MHWNNVLGVLILISRIYQSDAKVSLNIGIIGAGAAGLVTAKYCSKDGHNVTIYEQNKELGGVWLYTDEVGKNKYGLNIHSSMYKGLRTNAPLPIMEFPGHPYPNDTLSFPPHSDVLKYLHSFVDRFKLKKYIKFEHLVVHINPTDNEKWEIIIKDLPNNKFITQIYDVIFVCNGHYSVPFIPKIHGASKFKGKIMHSHNYRTAETFRDDTVLIIGDGPSGQDLLIQLSAVAKNVTLSRKEWFNATKDERATYQMKLPPGTAVKDMVKQFTVDGAQFVDGTKNPFSAIIFATGYEYSFPFLSVESGIHVDDSFIQPLYKHLININHPTMAFIGIPRSVVNFAMFDLQARFALKLFTHKEYLPSTEYMLTEQQKQAENLWNLGFSKRKTHTIIHMQQEYFDQLSNLADIDYVPSVLATLALDGVKKRDENPIGYRDYKFTVMDEKTYSRQMYKKL